MAGVTEGSFLPFITISLQLLLATPVFYCVKVVHPVGSSTDSSFLSEEMLISRTKMIALAQGPSCSDCLPDSLWINSQASFPNLNSIEH